MTCDATLCLRLCVGCRVAASEFPTALAMDEASWGQRHQWGKPQRQDVLVLYCTCLMPTVLYYTVPAPASVLYCILCVACTPAAMLFSLVCSRIRPSCVLLNQWSAVPGVIHALHLIHGTNACSNALCRCVGLEVAVVRHRCGKLWVPQVGTWCACSCNACKVVLLSVILGRPPR